MSALDNLNTAVTAIQAQQTADTAQVATVVSAIAALRAEISDGAALQTAADAINGVVTSMQANAQALSTAIAST